MDNINDINAGNINQPLPAKHKEPVLPPAEVKPEQYVVIDDLKNDPKDKLGRSQVKINKSQKPSKTEQSEPVGNTEEAKLRERLLADLEFLQSHPELVEKSNKVFDHAYENAVKKNDVNPYAAANNVQSGFIGEFGNK